MTVEEETEITWQPAPIEPTLANNEVHVWQASLTQPDAVIDALWPTLAQNEQERALRFHFDEHRRAYTVGRGLLRRLLGLYLKCEADEVQFGYTDYNKPFLALPIAGLGTTDSGITASNDPLSREFRFNLSHSGIAVLYAFSYGRELGVDVEFIKPNFDYLGVAEGFFSEAERAMLTALPVADQPQGFFNCWTRKEAYIKAHGEGLSLPLDQFDVTLRPGDEAKLLATRPDPTEADQWSLRALPMQQDYAAAIAVEGNAEWQLSAFKMWPQA